MDDHLKQDAMIEDALMSQPLAPMPSTVTADVMRRIQTDSRPALLSWNDVVLSFVVASCITALWFAAQNLPPMLLAKIRIQGILLYQDFLVNARWLVPAVFFGIAAMLSSMTIPYLIQKLKNVTYRG